MKNIILLSFVLLLLLQAGCTKSVRYSEEEIKAFPPETQERIRKAEIDLGMTQEQVRYAWGSPDSIKILELFEGKSREEWVYSHTGTMGVVGSRLLLFFDGKLIYVSK